MSPVLSPWQPIREEDERQLTYLVARYVRWLHPELVDQMVTFCADSEWQHECAEGLRSARILPELYLWPGGTCLYPGFRRFKNTGNADSPEVRNGLRAPGALKLSSDTNSHAKKVWTQLLGPGFDKMRRNYHLVHLFPHQGQEVAKHLTTLAAPTDPQEAQLVSAYRTIGLPGLFSSVANMCYLPGELTRPSDADSLLRRVLWHKALTLYPTALLPPVLAPLAQQLTQQAPLKEVTWDAPWVGTPLTKQALLELDKHRRSTFRKTLDEWRNANPSLVPVEAGY